MKPTNQQPDLTILIPAYHEEKRIGKTLDKLSAFLNNEKTLKDKQIEVIVVAADSTDNTHSAVLEKKDKFQNLKLLKPGPRVGKGRDVQYGMLRAKGKAIIFMDADLATPLKYITSFYAAFTRGADIVIAVRNLRRHHPSIVRTVVSNSGNILFRLAGGVWVEDSQCGFKLFSQKAAKLCFSKLRILGWGFDMEALAIARVNKIKIQSERVDDWVSVPGGTFVNGTVKNSAISLYELALIAGRRVKGNYRDL
jgi:dolichyl-phosphate beta-glucosyltransferase